MEALVAKYHLHPIFDHFTIALLAFGVLADVAGLVAMSRSGESARLGEAGKGLRRAALMLMVPGAISAILSRFTGESEAERLWDTISPVAQGILYTDTGSGAYLSHAVLGTYLMYLFIPLAAWRLLLEMWPAVKRTTAAYLAVAILATCALLYQGKTGGQLVYEHGVGMAHAASGAPQAASEKKIATSLP
jgi:uncharacterized membrane protein